MFLALTGLAFLIGAIALGFIKKINVGMVSIAAAFLLALLGGIPVNTVFTGFPTKLFLTILGTMYFFCLLQENKTLELLSQKSVSPFRKHPFWIPVVIFFASYILSAAGPGAISVQAVMVLFSMSLATQLHIPAVLLAAMAVFGSAGGTASPVALAGIIVTDLTATMNLPGAPLKVFYGVSVVHLVAGIIFYIGLGGYKLQLDHDLNLDKLPNFNRNQRFSLLAGAILFLCVIGLRLDIGLTCFVLALGLTLVKAVDEKKAFTLLPWNVLLLICGVNVLMNVIRATGGIKLFAAALAALMTPGTASALMAATAGAMSWFSSAHGVVLPALIPTVNDIAAQVGTGTNPVELIAAIVAAANIGGLGPMTTGGSLLMAAYVQSMHPDTAAQHKMFLHQFFLSMLSVLIVVVFALLGGFIPFCH
jgi:di/tricarboxylate transporter